MAKAMKAMAAMKTGLDTTHELYGMYEREPKNDELKNLVSGHKRRLQQIKEGIESWNDFVPMQTNAINYFQFFFVFVHFFSFVCHFAFVYRDVYDSDYKTVLYFLQGE